MTSAPPGPIRALTERQLQVADGIRRGLTYAEIAGELSRVTGKPVSLETVRTHVRHMAMLFDEPRELAPRWRIYMWVKHQEWAAEHPPPIPSTG
jgi:DNA-binding CsgD family transcriptional regulator